MRKNLTDEQLEQLGLLAKQQYEQAIETWRAAMKSLPLSSRQYRLICTAGRAARRVHDALFAAADDRGWSEEKLAATFSETGCGFT